MTAEVIPLAGWPPEVLAYAFAMYSRSPLSIRESIQKITGEKSAKFFEDYYFQYGHASIADNAHVGLAFEGISEIAAFELEDEQLWDGQERSTRYQDFSKSDSYFMPDSVLDAPHLLDRFTRLGSFLMTKYAEYSVKCFDWLTARNPKPAEMKSNAYERTMKARAFDVARYWLFNGITTNVGQITSARTLEGQISRLMSSEYKEVRELGQAIKNACESKPFCPKDKDEPPVAPTLVKYAGPNEFRIRSRELLKREAKKWLFWPSPNGGSRYVKLLPDEKSASYMTLLNEIVATLFYKVSNYPYDEILAIVACVNDRDKKELIEKILSVRGDHDPLPKAFAVGHKFQFDICMDRGGERDLHRHRNCIQIHQPLATERGWDVPALVRNMGLAADYDAGMRTVASEVETLRKEIGVDANYLIPFAFRSRTIYKMHLQQAAYMIGLRSAPQGHFSYREIACQMYDRLVQEYPFLKEVIRVTPFEQNDLLKR